MSKKDIEIKYKNISEEEANKLYYLISNSYEFIKGTITNINIVYEDNILIINLLWQDNKNNMKRSSIQGVFKENYLLINNLINNGLDEYSSIDTFYFEQDNIRVISSSKDLNEPLERRIKYKSAHFL